MGQTIPSKLNQEDVEEICKNTGFRRGKVHQLFDRFCRMDRQKLGYLRREDFLIIPELAVNPLGELVVERMFEDYGTKYNDLNQEGINFKQFVNFLAHFKPVDKEDKDYPNSKQARISYLFKLYDHNNDGYICKSDLENVLKQLAGDHIDFEQISLIANTIIRDIDENDDYHLSFEEFFQAMQKHDLETLMSIRFLA